jgi:hypothetical protein
VDNQYNPFFFVSSWPVMPLLTGLLLKAVTAAGQPTLIEF